MEAFITVAAVMWLPLLWFGIVLARRINNEEAPPWYIIPHGMSTLCLIGLLATITRYMDFTIETVGGKIFLVFPTAVAINLLFTWAASTFWPRCKKCRTRMVLVRRGVDDEGGFSTEVKCTECGQSWWRD